MIDVVLWLHALVWGALFLWSYWREPRQFRNAFFFFLLLRVHARRSRGDLRSVVDHRSRSSWPSPLTPVVTIVFMLVNEVTLVRREGFSFAHALPLLFACAIVAWFCALPGALALQAPGAVVGFILAITACGAWFFLSFAALLLYSWLYRSLPRKRHYEFIIIHGAGLAGEELTPLLRGRVERAYELWVTQGRHATLVPSGGQGEDEEISEAEAMARHLRILGVPDTQMLLEDRSTTTWENLKFSRDLIAEHSSGGAREVHWSPATITCSVPPCTRGQSA